MMKMIENYEMGDIFNSPEFQKDLTRFLDKNVTQY